MIDTAAIRYRAFLSYSHRDKAWGEWLHRALESYRIDKDLVGRQTPAGPVPKSLRPIFRDREDFAAGHSLTEQTLAALEASQFLIVICSPNAAQSQYVNEEIRRFKALGRCERIIPVIVEGEPGDTNRECFPPALRFKVGSDGALTDEREEPIAADAREQGDGKEIATQKMVAGLLGVGLDEILRRAERARRRRNRFWAALAGVFLLLAITASGSAVYAYKKLLESEDRLDQAIEIAYGFVSEATSMSDRFGVPVDVRLSLLKRADAALAHLIDQGASTAKLRYRKAVMLMIFADSYQALGSAEAMQRAVEARELLEALIKGNNVPLAWQKDLVEAYLRIGNLSESPSNAIASYRTGQAIAERMVAAEPSNTNWQRYLAMTRGSVGQELLLQRSLPEAVAEFEAAFSILEQIIRVEPENADALRVLAVQREKIGDVRSTEGAYGDALASHRASLALRERLLTIKPDSVQYQRDAAIAHLKIAQALKALGKFAEAIQEYRTSLAMVERLAAADPKDTHMQRDVANGYSDLGAALKASGALDDALTSYRTGQSVLSRVALRSPDNPSVQEEMSFIDAGIADVLRAQGKLDEAAASYRKSLANRQRISGDGKDLRRQRNLANAHSVLGDVLVDQGVPAEAVEHYRATLAIRERVAAADPNDIFSLRTMMATHEKVGDVLRASGKPGDAIASYQAAVAIRERLISGIADRADALVGLANAYDKIAETQDSLGLHREVIATRHKALEAAQRAADAAPGSVPHIFAVLLEQWSLAEAGDDSIHRLEFIVATLRELKTANKLTQEQLGVLTEMEDTLARLKNAQASHR